MRAGLAKIPLRGCISGVPLRYRILVEAPPWRKSRMICPLWAPLFLLSALPVYGQATTRLPLDDFEREPQGWKYIGGEEFPGAKGSLALDGGVAHGGKSSYRLEADFCG